MGEAARQPWIDYPTYLQIERDTDVRHEWFDGCVYAMVGGTLEHSALSGSIIGELRSLIHPRACQVHTSDAKVRVPSTGFATYPDASVVCGPIVRDADDRNAMNNPVILVEVLSDSTEGYDRGEKFHHYRQLPSLRDYVLVSQHEPRIEVYSRDAADRWVLTVAEAGATIALTALPGLLSVDRVYEGIELAPRPAPPPR